MIYTLELFSGTASFSKVAKARGYSTLTLDIDSSFSPDIVSDIMDITSERLLSASPIRHFNYLWASPPCDCFSVASISRYWYSAGDPKDDKARHALDIIKKTVILISEIKPDRWYIENPRGMLRKMIDDIFKSQGMTRYKRVTVTYCQYGDKRMKPTDIWTNDVLFCPLPPCKNGASCHIPAPRGSPTGTQGIKGKIDRAVIPVRLIEEIFKDG
jgi:hypothetical protein